MSIAPDLEPCRGGGAARTAMTGAARTRVARAGARPLATDTATAGPDMDLDMDLGLGLGIAPDVCVLTARGDIPAGRLAPGALIMTRDRGLRPLRWIGLCGCGRDRAAPTAADAHAVRITAGALGGGLPRRDLTLSAGQWLAIRGPALRAMLAAQEAIVPAAGLIGLPGVQALPRIRGAAAGAGHLALLLDRHEILFAHGAMTESLQPSGASMAGMGPLARAQIAAAAPWTATPRRTAGLAPARLRLTLRETQELVARMQNAEGFVPEALAAMGGPEARAGLAAPAERTGPVAPGRERRGIFAATRGARFAPAASA